MLWQEQMGNLYTAYLHWHIIFTQCLYENEIFKRWKARNQNDV